MKTKEKDSKVFFITGAGKGIGKAIALEIARESQLFFSPKLFLVSRTRADLDQVEAEIETVWGSKQSKNESNLVESKAIGPDFRCFSFCGDLSDMSILRSALAACKREFGSVHVLINNAGTGVFKDFGSYEEGDFEKVFLTNVKAAFFLSQAVFNDMKIAKRGDIVFITSTAAEKPYEQGAMYCASKFAQKGLLEVIRIPARKAGIRILNIMPGPVYTQMWGVVDETTKQRMILPEDVARTVVSALSRPPGCAIEEVTIRPTGGDLQEDPGD